MWFRKKREFMDWDEYSQRIEQIDTLRFVRDVRETNARRLATQPWILRT